MIKEESDPFERAAAREIELRERQRIPMPPGLHGYRGTHSLAQAVGGFAFFALTLPLTLIFARNITWLVITHGFMVAAMGAGALSSWVRSKGDNERRT